MNYNIFEGTKNADETNENGNTIEYLGFYVMFGASRYLN